MALVRGSWTTAVGHSGGYTIQENFGPFDIGPGLRDGGRGGQGEGSLEEVANVWGSKLEGVRGSVGTSCDHKVSLCCPPYSS